MLDPDNGVACFAVEIDRLGHRFQRASGVGDFESSRRSIYGGIGQFGSLMGRREVLTSSLRVDHDESGVFERQVDLRRTEPDRLSEGFGCGYHCCVCVEARGAVPKACEGVGGERKMERAFESLRGEILRVPISASLLSAIDARVTALVQYTRGHDANKCREMRFHNSTGTTSTTLRTAATLSFPFASSSCVRTRAVIPPRPLLSSLAGRI